MPYDPKKNVRVLVRRNLIDEARRAAEQRGLGDFENSSELIRTILQDWLRGSNQPSTFPSDGGALSDLEETVQALQHRIDTIEIRLNSHGRMID